MKTPILVIFGGTDHEEQAARKVCQWRGIWTATATVNGVKCHAGNAYQADGCDIDGNYYGNDDAPIVEVVIFECADGACPKNGQILARCDHHNPGDHGYGLGPDKFWEASSLGQLCAILGVDPIEELLMVAAGDHCPAAAYKGLCPGIDPVKFRVHRIEGLSTTVECPAIDYINGEPGSVGYYNNREEVEKAINFATKLIELSPMSLFDGVKDLRQYGKVEQLPEAALISGYAYLSQIPDTDRAGNPTGNIKVNLGGDNSPQTVTKVIEWLNGLPSGVSPAYGVPARGFCGRVFKSVWMPS